MNRYVWVRHPTGTAHLHLVVDGDQAARAKCGQLGAGAQELAGQKRWGCTRCSRYVSAVEIMEPATLRLRLLEVEAEGDEAVLSALELAASVAGGSR